MRHRRASPARGYRCSPSIFASTSAPRQPQPRRVVAQGPILAHTPLHLSRPGRHAGVVHAAGRHPMHAQIVFVAKPQRHASKSAKTHAIPPIAGRESDAWFSAHPAAAPLNNLHFAPRWTHAKRRADSPLALGQKEPTRLVPPSAPAARSPNLRSNYARSSSPAFPQAANRLRPLLTAKIGRHRPIRCRNRHNHGWTNCEA